MLLLYLKIGAKLNVLLSHQVAIISVYSCDFEEKE